MKKILYALLTGTCLYLLVNLITPYNHFLKKRSINNQIVYLDKILSEGYDLQAQRRYPEGKLFSNALFALAVIEYASKLEEIDTALTTIIDKRINRLLEKSTTESFVQNMTPEYGAFYNGWINFTIKKYLESPLFQKSKKQAEVLSAHKLFSQRLEKAQQDSIRIIASYPGSHWPADNLVGIVSIDNDTIQERWLEKIYAASSAPSNLIYHVNSSPDEIRGSSQALIIYLLSQYKEKLALQANQQFKALLHDKFLGIEFVKEYEKGSLEEGDLDSGPIFFGYGAVATIMNMKTQAQLKNKSSRNTWAFLNVLAVPINLLNKKFYLFKQEPMFDIFMLWCAVEL